MASNKITYTFIAIDEFSKIANKISRSAKKLTESINKTSNIANKGFVKSANQVNAVSKKTEECLTKVSTKVEHLSKNATKSSSQLAKFGQNLGHLASPEGGIAHFGERIAKLSDFFGMGAYYRFMNIALPMTLVAKLGLDYADSLEAANIQMESLFSHTKDFAVYQKKIAEMGAKYGATTRFSTAQIIGAAATVGRMTGNIRVAAQVIPVVMKYAIATGQTKDLSAAATKFMSGVRTGMMPEIGLRLTGGSAQQRLMQASAAINKRYTGIIAKDSATAGAQLAIFMHQFQKLAGAIMGDMGPAFAMYGRLLHKIMPSIQRFIKAHSKLIVTLGIISVAAYIFLGVLMALGAIIGIIAMPFEVLTYTILALGKAFKIARVSAIFLTATTKRLALVSIVSAAAMGILRGAVLAFRGVWLLLNMAFAASPIGFIITLISLLGVGLYELITHFGAVKKAVYNAFEPAKHLISSIRKDIKGLIADLSKVGSALHSGYSMAKAGVRAGASEFHQFEHMLHVNVNVNDKGGHVESVHTQGTGTVQPMSHAQGHGTAQPMTHAQGQATVYPTVNLGRNLAHT